MRNGRQNADYAVNVGSFSSMIVGRVGHNWGSALLGKNDVALSIAGVRSPSGRSSLSDAIYGVGGARIRARRHHYSGVGRASLVDIRGSLELWVDAIIRTSLDTRTVPTKYLKTFMIPCGHGMVAKASSSACAVIDRQDVAPSRYCTLSIRRQGKVTRGVPGTISST